MTTRDHSDVSRIGPALPGKPNVRTISLETIDTAAAALAKASGIIHACQNTLHGATCNPEEVGNALWAAWDLLQPFREALRGDE